jgi:peptidoglycan/xylan/chitin deacetylase (PgdA/CDA1 family)
MRTRLVFAVKCGIAYVLYGLGLLHLWKKIALRNRVVVLTYHRVLGPEERAETWSHPAIVVDRETFNRHVSFLKRTFRPITVGQFIARRGDDSKTPSAACLITFDDGWHDTYTEAWPVLRRHGVPGVVFLPVNFIGTDRVFWQEQMARAVFAIAEHARRDSGFAVRAHAVLRSHGLDAVLSVAPPELRGRTADSIRACKHLPPAVLREMTADVVALAASVNGAAGYVVDRFLTWEQVREMAADGVTFGGHGAEHHILTTVPESEARYEIEQSRELIRQHIGAPVTAFSYPNGDWNPTVAELVRGAGYQVAFATTHPPFEKNYAVRRVNIHEDTTSNIPMFFARVLGVF